jgi:hypothetical protein
MRIHRFRILLALATVLGPRLASASVVVTGGLSLSGSEGILLSNIAVATFTDSRPGATSGQLTATINWGDSTTSAGTIAALMSGFGVTGTHTYAEEGSYTRIVTVTDTVDSSNGTVTDTATMADAPLSPTGFNNFSFVPGSQVSPNLMSFIDANPFATVSDFSATINWGDSTASSGTIAFTAGSFRVSGVHTYVNAGNFPVTVSVTDVGGEVITSSLTASTVPEPSSASAVLGGIGIVAFLLRRVRSR